VCRASFGRLSHPIYTPHAESASLLPLSRMLDSDIIQIKWEMVESLPALARDVGASHSFKTSAFERLLSDFGAFRTQSPAQMAAYLRSIPSPSKYIYIYIFFFLTPRHIDISPGKGPLSHTVQMEWWWLGRGRGGGRWWIVSVF
jgi:hypothetical protein